MSSFIRGSYKKMKSLNNFLKIENILILTLVLSYSLIFLILIIVFFNLDKLDSSIFNIYKDLPIRVLYDFHDIDVYFKSSDWVVEEGQLYTDIPSEYPLAANLLFGFCRLISNLFRLDSFTNNPYYSFIVTWFFLGLSTWLVILKNLNQIVGNNKIIKLCWILPAALYFSAYRYDIFPTLFFILSITHLKRKKLLSSALYLGISISLKGYALFTIPSIFYYLNYNFGFKKSFNFLIISSLPLLIFNFSTLIFLGKEALEAPYQFHLLRSFNGESTWDALNLKYLVKWIPFLPTLSTCITSIIGFFKKPRTLDQLANSCLLAITGFASSLIFYSPQFCLWILSAATFSKNKRVLILTYFLCFFSFIYFPITYDIKDANETYYFIFKMFVLIVTYLRLFLMAELIFGKKINSKDLLQI